MSELKAFPHTFPETTHVEWGMDLRDYFAAKAMQAIISKSDERSTAFEEIDLWVGAYSYRVANAMMEVRNESK